jgi:hypothetical protein
MNAVGGMVLPHGSRKWTNVEHSYATPIFESR